MKRKVTNKMDDFLINMTCEEFYSEDSLTEEEKKAILDEIAQTTEEEGK
jgi:6-pyruvoyl-tetrahydropterin synthase